MPNNPYSAALAQQQALQQQAESFYVHRQCYPSGLSLPTLPMKEEKEKEQKINKKLLLLED